MCVADELKTVDKMLAEDIARLMAQIPLEDGAKTGGEVEGGAFQVQVFFGFFWGALFNVVETDVLEGEFSR